MAVQIFTNWLTDCYGSSQTRFQDHCYEYASSSSGSDIINNIDACKAKGSDLWVPETSAEHHFVAQTFPGASENDNLYHLGILRYIPKQGFYGVDNSFHVGNTYFSRDSDLKSQNLEKLVIDASGSCLIYNKVSDTWEKKDPCINAVGVCKSRLGNEYLKEYIKNYE